MRVSKEEMGKSHRRILDGAARLMRERGMEGTSVGDAMSAAGLKQGGFYRHFESKDALAEAALRTAFEQILTPLEARLAENEHKAAISEYRAHYLSPGHVEQRGAGCPIAALATDVARGPEKMKTTFSEGVNRMISALAKGMDGSAEEKTVSATRELAMMVGAVVIARAGDGETTRHLLAACRKSAEGSLDATSPKVPGPTNQVG